MHALAQAVCQRCIAPLTSSAARSRRAPLLPADFNEIVIATSRPEQVDASSIYFTGVSHRGVTINWKAPGLGEWAWPMVGYVGHPDLGRVAVLGVVALPHFLHIFRSPI